MIEVWVSDKKQVDSLDSNLPKIASEDVSGRGGAYIYDGNFSGGRSDENGVALADGQEMDFQEWGSPCEARKAEDGNQTDPEKQSFGLEFTGLQRGRRRKFLHGWPVALGTLIFVSRIGTS